MTTKILRHCQWNGISRISILMLFVLGFACFADAQQYAGLDIRMPKVEKIIVLTADDVNLRKAPSTTAPKLMGIEDEMGEYSVFWSNKSSRGESMKFMKDAPLMVLSETDEWYGVPYMNRMDKNLMVYVSKKFAKEIQPSRVTPEFIQSQNEFVMTKGRYRGYFAVNVTYEGDIDYCFGRIVNDMAVCNNFVTCDIGKGENDLKRIKFEGFDRSSFPSILFGRDVCKQVEDMNYPDFSKLTDNEMNTIIKTIKGDQTFRNSDRGYILVNYNNELKWMEYDLSEPMFKNKAVTIPAKGQN